MITPPFWIKLLIMITTVGFCNHKPQATSEEYLPDESFDFKSQEVNVKEMLPEEGSTENNIGLVIEEDEAAEQPEEGSSPESPEEI
jgi:hypothetical protein